MKSSISKIAKFEGQQATISGWMFNKRGSGKIQFLELRDGSGTIQAIVSKDEAGEEVFAKSESLTPESSLHITGKVSKHPKLENVYELHVTDIEIVHLATDEYPISKKEHGPDFLLDHRHLWLRSKKQWAILRLRNSAIYSIYEFLAQEGFIKVDAPIFTPSACEGTTELFEVDHFGEPVYLSQSGQLYIEAAIFSVGRCYDFGPVFRAEKSKTRRHLTEFWMMDAEMPFCEQDENMDIQEAMVKHIVKNALRDCAEELQILERDTAELQLLLDQPFHRITHKEAVKMLNDAGYMDAREDDDFGADEEVALVNMFDRPLFVMDYPAEVKAFYMKRSKRDSSKAACADLLVKNYGEIIGGSQREDDYDTLLQRIKDHNLPVDHFQWYLDLRRFGSVPHSGFGIGLERAVLWLSGHRHIREAIPFPRTINRITP
jgi:asparaginyl-tRNA synthetase